MISDSITSNFFCYTILPDNLRTQYRFLSIVALTENNLKYAVENKQTHQHFLLTVTAPTLKITAHSSHRILEKTEHYQFELTPFEESTKLSKVCFETLKNVEAKVSVIKKELDEIKEKPFPVE